MSKAVKSNSSSSVIELSSDFAVKAPPPAEKKQRLKFETQTISFDEEDATDLELEKDKEYHMLEFFELLLCILS